MKKIISIIIISAMLLAGCGPKAEDTKTTTDNKVQETEKVKTKETKPLGVGEAYTFKNGKDDYYSIVINGVKEANDFEYKESFANVKQIVEVDYTYKNISKDDEVKLYIHGGDLLVMDSTGAVAQSSDMFPKQPPETIPVGASCTVQAYYGLTNRSDKIKISFESIALKQTIEFEVKLNKSD